MSILRWFDDGLSVADRQRIVRGTLHSFLIQGFSVLLVFVSNLLLVRASDANSYGLFVHVFNWVSILSVIVISGRDDLVLALLPRYLEGEHARMVGLVRAVNRWILVAALVVGVAFVLLLRGIRIGTLSDHEGLFRMAMIAVYLTAAMGLNQLILQALNRVRMSQVVEKLVKPVLLLVGVGLLRLAGVTLNAQVLVILSSVVLGVCCGGLAWLVVRSVRMFGVRAAGVDEGNEVGEVGVGSGKVARDGVAGKTSWFFLISLFYLLSTKITMLMLPVYLPAKDIGIFNISYRFADLLIFPFFLMHTVLPQLFARHAETGRAYTQSLFSESNKLMTLLSLPLLVVVIAGGPLLLRLFGHEFEGGYSAMIYLSLAQLLFSLFGPANTILMMQDRERWAAGCLFVYVAALAGTSRWLIPAGGVTGGAVAILISSAFYNLVLAVVLYRVCGVVSPFFSWLFRWRSGSRKNG